MFSSAIKGNQRSNGLYTLPKDIGKHSNHKNHKAKLKDGQNHKKLEKLVNGNPFGGQVTKRHDPEDRIGIHSIIGFNDVKTHKPVVVEQKVKKEIRKVTRHETLQRIECEKEEANFYQQQWFSASLEKFKLEDRSREERIEITRHEYLRRLQQMRRSTVGKPNKMPDWVERRKDKVHVQRIEGQKITGNPPEKTCEVSECGKVALLSSKYCIMHIMYDSRQVLFEYCTAKFADNTQCSTPIFDISHELPLCAEHARKRDNYRLYQEAKPKKMRRKVKPSAMIRPQKRGKKKKKPQPVADNSAIIDRTNIPELVNAMPAAEPVVLEEDMHIVDQVLALNENGLEQALANQAHLLEETDINNVLSTIHVDEFSDFFAVNRNGEFEPSREDAEKLEKALAEVDNDVKSLEQLSQTHGLLDSFLDDHALSESLVQIPEMMFHNGYAACGDNIVAQSSSYLLPVEPHSHS